MLDITGRPLRKGLRGGVVTNRALFDIDPFTMVNRLKYVGGLADEFDFIV
jgi:hypothetical protein